MATETTELTPKHTAGWPATPDYERWQKAHTAMAMVQGAMQAHPMDLIADRGAYTIETPRGETLEFDASHEKQIKPPERIILNAHKVRSGQALHNCLQSAIFTRECDSLFKKIMPNGQAEEDWFLHTAAELGDSRHTIGVAIQRHAPGDRDKSAPAVIKLARNERWMGFNTGLQELQGLTFWIFGARDCASIPSYAVGSRSDQTPEGVAATRVEPSTKTEKGMLAKIFKYHGAEKTLWIPRI